MRTILTLFSLGVMLALGGAALAKPADRHAKRVDRHAVHLDRKGNAAEQNRNYYRHKRYYRHDEGRREKGSGTIRLPRRRDHDGFGKERPNVRQPPVRARPLLGISA